MSSKIFVKFGDLVSIEHEKVVVQVSKNEFCNKTIANFLDQNKIRGRWICSNKEPQAQTWIDIDSAETIISAKRIDQKVKIK